MSYKLNGICFDIHNKLSRYGKEKQYADELEFELKRAGIKYVRELRICREDGFTDNIFDFVIEDRIVLELKAKGVVAKDDYYQLKRYLVTLN